MDIETLSANLLRQMFRDCKFYQSDDAAEPTKAEIDAFMQDHLPDFIDEACDFVAARIGL